MGHLGPLHLHPHYMFAGPRRCLFRKCCSPSGAPNPYGPCFVLSRSHSLLYQPEKRLTHSYTEGPDTPPLLHQTLPGYFDSVLLPNYADFSALISRHESVATIPGPLQQTSSSYVSWTFQELDERVAALSKGLSKMGIGKGDRVAVIMGNSR